VTLFPPFFRCFAVGCNQVVGGPGQLCVRCEIAAVALGDDGPTTPPPTADHGDDLHPLLVLCAQCRERCHAAESSLCGECFEAGLAEILGGEAA
jgi:hypothetical protein